MALDARKCIRHTLGHGSATDRPATAILERWMDLLAVLAPRTKVVRDKALTWLAHRLGKSSERGAVELCEVNKSTISKNRMSGWLIYSS
jgi:hypothetical protein